MKRLLYLSRIWIIIAFLVPFVKAQIPVTVTNPTNTTPNLASNYNSLADALNALNGVNAMSGPVILTCTGGNSETAPVKGFVIGSSSLNPVLDATNTITINTSGGTVTINAGVGTSSGPSAAPDGMLYLNGADYVTIDGLTFTDGNSANATVAMEFGIALFKRAAGDGCNYNTIQNCIFNMQRINNVSGSGPLVDGSVGIGVYNSTAAAATTALTPTNGGTLATNGTNSNNKFYANTINSGNYGIALNGYAASSGVGPTPNPATFLGDLNNDIGGSSSSQGNTILNYGGGGSSNPAAGIRANNQWSINISYNNINNNNGGGVNHTTTLRGIFAQAGTSANATINNNTVSVQSGATTSACTAIDNGIGSTAASNTVTINNNFISIGYSTATTGVYTAINNSATAATVNINGNTISQISGVALAGTGTHVMIETGSPTTVTTNNNIIQNISRNGASGSWRGIKTTNPTNWTCNGNTIENLSWTAAASTGGIDAIYSFSSAVNVTVNNNIIKNLSTPTTGTINGIREYGISGNKTFQLNEIYNFLTTGGGAGGATFNGIWCTVGNIEISKNTIYSLNSTGTTGGTGGTVYGINISGGTTNNLYKNKIYDLSSTSSNPVVAGIVLSSGTTNTVYNNIIGDLRTPAANAANPLIGISVTGGTTVNLYYNTVWLEASSSGALFGSSAISASTTPNLTLRNNIFTNYSTPNGAGLTVSYRRSSTTLTTYQNASNNNDFHGLVPATIYYDGTTAYSFPLFQTLVGPIRDAASFSVLPPFLSYIGALPTFLHINPLTPTALESGASNIAGITDDFDSNIRQGNPGYPPQVNGGGVAPDVGADEFDGTLLPLPKTLQSITYNQASTAFTYAGANDVEILRIDFAVAGNSGTLNLNSIVVNSLNTSDADVSAVKLYRTSTTTFSTANPLGSSTNFSGGNAAFSSLSYDLPSGTTYIWVVYDVSSGATFNNILDAQIQANQIDVAGNTYPAADQSPTGSRQIKIGPITSFPFTEDFEGGNFNNWFVVNGAQTNQWAVGTATNNGGSYAAYISNDGGTSNAYTTTSASVVHFYRDVTFPGSGEFHIAFNWKGVGETTLYDYLRVFLIDPSTIPVAGTQLSSGQIGSDYYNQSTWQSVDLTVAPGNLGTTKRLVFSWRNDGSLGSQPPAAIDNIQIYQAANMAYSSSTTTQNTSNTLLGSTNQQVIGIQIVTTGSTSPISVTKFRINANGTTAISDISNAKIYYTGTSSTFTTTTQFGLTYASPTIADFDITDNGSPQVLAQGTNYFWLTYDISGSATDGNLVDAECTQITVAGTDYTPTVTAPSGARTIRGPMSGNYNVGLTPFNKAAGTNLYTQRFTRMVERKVYEQPQITDRQRAIENVLTAKSIDEMENSNMPYRTEMVEEEYFMLMENGQPYYGPLSVANTSSNSPEGIESSETFATLTEAVANLNLRGVSGWVQFNLKDAAYNTGTGETFPILINNFAGASSSNTVTIKPASGVSPVITGSTSSSVIALNGCDYVIIDGSNQTGGSSKDLTISNTYTGGTFNFAVGLYHNGTKGATNSTVKNCVLRGTPTVTNSYGLFLNAAGGAFHNTSVINNTIKNAKIGMQFVGVSGSVTNNGLISGNTIGDAAEPLKQGGIVASYVDNLIISANEIFGEAAGNSNNSQFGVQLGTGATNSKIRKNNIHDFYYNGTGGYGCFGIIYNCGAAANDGTTEIYNNFISNIKGDGDQETTSAGNMVWLPQGICIFTNGTAGIKIYHNTVHMTGATLGSTYNGSSACLGIAGTVATGCMDIQNNIFRNSMTPAGGPNPSNNETMCIWVPSAAGNNIFSVIDYNNYFGDGNLPNVGYFTSLKLNLAAWQGASGQDANSKEVAVNFVGAPDLHLAGASIGDINLLGANLTSVVADDIDGDTRLAPPMGPYMGADEGSMPLPVELSAFIANVRVNVVRLSWTTKTEINSAMFEVQRSKDSHEWINVGMVQASGNSSSPKEYSFTDSKLQSGKYSYRLRMVDADGKYTYSNVIEAEVGLPSEYAISQNYPNPFNPTTRIDYQLPFDSRVTIELYGITGEKVATIVNTDLSAGYYTAEVNAGQLNLASGVYIYRIAAAGVNNQNFSQVKKLVLTK